MNPDANDETDLKKKKEALECAKIEAEIASLRKSLFRTPQFYAALGPVAFVIAGIIVSWGNGWFDVQSRRIENSITELEVRKRQAEFETQQKQTETRRTLEELAQLRARAAEQAEIVEKQSSQIARLEKMKETLEGELRSLAGADEKARAYVAEVTALQAACSDLENARRAAEGRLDTANRYAAALERAVADLRVSFVSLNLIFKETRAGRSGGANFLEDRVFWTRIFLRIPETEKSDEAYRRRVLQDYEALAPREVLSDSSESASRDLHDANRQGSIEEQDRLRERFEAIRKEVGIPSPQDRRN